MATAESIAAKKRIARQVPEEIATPRNLDLIEEIYAEDAVEHDPFGDHEGIEAIRKSFEIPMEAFPDMTATVEEIICEGDMVAMWVRLQGTHDGPFAGLEPTGKDIDIQNFVFTRVEDGKIQERWLQPDMLGLLQQVGAVDLDMDVQV